jgi:hypothetical protein
MVLIKLLLLLMIAVVTHLMIHLIGVMMMILVVLLVWLRLILIMLQRLLEMHWELIIRNETWLGLVISTFELSLVPLSLAELGIISRIALVSLVGVVHP